MNKAVTRQCLICKKDILVRPWQIKDNKGKYCSKKCFYIGRGTFKVCPVCNHEFRIKKKVQRYCSNICRIRHQSNQIARNCPTCNKTYYATPYIIRNAKKYCSKKCAYIGIRKEINRICPVCNITFKTKPYQKRIYCSTQCRQLDYRGEKHPFWKGGRHSDRHGYIQVQILPSDEYFAMSDKCGYVLEHRLIMAQHQGRPLTKSEIVHHKDGNPKNNHISNLELRTKTTHIHGRDPYQDRITELYHLIKKQENYNKYLETEITRLKIALVVLFNQIKYYV